eukprot:jgi/Ulvmu1/10232/UM060_0033.1
MPVTPQYEWSQTVDRIIIRVRLPGITRQKADIFATDVLVKVVAHPYVLILDLHAEVDSDNGSAYASPGEVVFRLPKKEHCTWDNLIYSGSKCCCEDRRHASIEQANQIMEERRRQHVDRLAREKKASTDNQIEVNRRKRQAIEAAKASELQAEVAELDRWKSGLPTHTPGHQGKLHAVRGVTDQCSPRDQNSKGRQGDDTSTSELADKGDDTEDMSPHAQESESFHRHTDLAGNSVAPLVPICVAPPPRETLQPVEIDFTKLEFPHLPAREQREEELRLYKKAQADAKQVANAAEIADQQPAFLKDKADGMYSQRNYHAAVNGYTSAIERAEEGSPLSLTCRLNRAACYTRLGCCAECIADCDHVLNVLQAPAGPAGDASDEHSGKMRAMRLKALTRRSTAHAQCGDMQQAHTDCQEALGLDPTNKQLLTLLGELTSSDDQENVACVQERARARFASGQYSAAADAFTALASLHKGCSMKAANALSNQAMCLLCMHRFEEALEACQAALSTATGWRSIPDKAAETVLELLHGTLSKPDAPPMIMKCFGRMAACRAHMKDHTQAERLYRIAAGVAAGHGNDAAADVFFADARHVTSLINPSKPAPQAACSEGNMAAPPQAETCTAA